MKKEKQFEIYLQKLEEINKNENKDYKIVSIYEGSEKNVTFRFTDKDGILRNFKMTPHNFFNNGYRLPKNFSKNKGITEFKKNVFNLVKDEYIVLGNYINSQTKIKIKHQICGREYEVLPNEFLQGKRCAKCSGRMKLNTDIFKERVQKLVGEEYKVIGEYKNSDTPITLFHSKCLNTFEIPPKEFTGKKQRRCPYCNGLSSGISLNAKKILDFLNNSQISFKREKIHLINKSRRKYDFYIKDSNLYIEFDGEQHFNENHFTFKNFKSNSLLEIQEIDNQKNEWILKNNLILLRIPYTKNSSEINAIMAEFIKLNDQAKAVGIDEIRKSISEMGGFLVYNYPRIRYDLIVYRKINTKNNV